MLRRQLGFGTVTEVRTLGQLMAALEQHPECAVATVDLALPGMNGAATLRTLRERFPSVRIVVVTQADDRETILLCLAAGIHGYILKKFQSAEICAALRFIIKGHVFVPSVLSEIPEQTAIAAAGEQRLATNVLGGLTQRQREVISLMAEGRSNKEIARALRIAPGTVKVHVNAAFRALGVHNRVSATVALQRPAQAQLPELNMLQAG